MATATRCSWRKCAGSRPQLKSFLCQLTKRNTVPLPLCPQSAAPTGTKEAEEHGLRWRVTQGGAPPSASLALGWYVSRFQRFCRFAALKSPDDTSWHVSRFQRFCRFAALKSPRRHKLACFALSALLPLRGAEKPRLHKLACFALSALLPLRGAEKPRRHKLACFALSALLPLRGDKCQIGQVRPGGPYHA